jgi:tetratricopeptide (TPR) repeat protein
MKIFIGHSFADKETQLIQKFKDHIESVGNIEIITGEKAQNSSVAEKVKRRIGESDVFVGIFTHDDKVKVGGFLNKEIYYTTSNWVIQESGYALGLDKKLILLVEHGINKFPELQGDLEIINFNRQSLEQTFTKLNQMITTMAGSQGVIMSGQTGVNADLSEVPVIKGMEEPNGKSEEIKDAWEKYFNSFDTKDPKVIKKAYETELMPLLSEDEKLKWKCVTLRIAHSLGDSNAYTELVNLSEKYSDNPEVLLQLAYRLKHMGENQKARDKFLQVKNIYDVSNESDKEHIIDCYVEASYCLVAEGNYNEAINSLTRLLFLDDFQNQKALILKGLANVAKQNKDMDDFVIYAEGCLNIEPTDTTLRFSLAYEYAHQGYKKLSLLHYKRLIDTTEDSMGLNNLGVQYKRLNLIGKSIDSFYRAADKNVTLAMANLADRYLLEGFTEDARRMIKKANDLSKDGIDVSANVGYSKHKLDTMLKEEEDKEITILIEAERERIFRVKYAEAFLSGNSISIEQLEGLWETPWGDLEITFSRENNSFKSEHKTQLSSIKTRTVIIEGTIKNLSGRYKISVEDATKYSDKWTSKDKVHVANGYFLLHKDNHEIIEILESDQEDKVMEITWKKKTN